nr:hypothetical protein [Tanacetum cinerariifolium]
MDTLSLVLEYLKDLEKCMDDGDLRIVKEMKLFDALEHKSVVIKVGNQKFAIFTKVPLRAFGEPFMRYSLPCKVDGQGAWDAKLDLADSANYVTEKVLDSIGFVHVSISDYCRKMVNDVNVEIHGVMFKADFVVLDYANEGEPSIMFGRDFLATTKSQVDFELGEIRTSLNMFKEVNGVVDILEEVGSSSEKVVRWGRQNATKASRKMRSEEKKLRNESWFDTLLEDPSGPVKQEGLSPGWELDMVVVRQKVLPPDWRMIFFIIAVQTPGSGISILLAVGTPSTGSGNLYCQWELSPGMQTLGSGIFIPLAVGTPSTGSGKLYCQWELSPSSGNALCILFPTIELIVWKRFKMGSFSFVRLE